MKVMLTCFFDSQGIVHHDYSSEGQTINKEYRYYLKVLRHLQNAVRRKRPDMLAAKNFQLHHDRAHAHTPQVIQAFLIKNNMPLVRQVPYYPNLAPCDFWLFPKLKLTLKGRRFQSREDIMKKSTEELQGILELGVQKVFLEVQGCHILEKSWKVLDFFFCPGKSLKVLEFCL